MVMAMGVGPLFSPPDFSWVQHSTSEQAGQQLDGAWIMRTGFVGYGLATLLAALNDWATRPLVRAALVVFGLGLIGAAIWSNASILPDVSSDLREDWLHSVASGAVGSAFASACALRLFGPYGLRRDGLAWSGLVISVAVPIAMVQLPELRGLLQRGMFLCGGVYVAREFGQSGTNA